ncbi:MAG TPA: SEC-C metal-binding domain-containing protein, partial [Gemmatimonadales bacterium]
YDDVMNQQREVAYSLRLFSLERGEELKAEARQMISSALDHAVRKFLAEFDRPEDWDRKALIDALSLSFLVTPDAIGDAAAVKDVDAAVKAAQAEGEAAFHRKVDYLREFGRGIGIADVDQQILSQVMLSVIDEKWKDHLYDLDQLRNAIQYRAYGQKDPLVEYKKEAYEMFEDLMRDIQATFTERYLKITVTAEPPRQPPPPPIPTPRSGTDELFAGASRTSTGPMGGPPPRVETPLGRVGSPSGGVPEVGRNDPCPCGSGKKYKKCHGAGR